MAATAATTIEGVSLLTEKGPESGDVFDVGLSPDGLEVRRPGGSGRQLAWDEVSEWTIEARPNGVLLTLRGRNSSVIRLVIPRWTSENLDTVLHDVTSHDAQSNAESEPTPQEAPDDAAAASERGDGAPERGDDARGRAPTHARDRRSGAGRRVTWKAAGTIVLLAVLATAVTLVLLQSAGVISWGFLGPTA